MSIYYAKRITFFLKNRTSHVSKNQTATIEPMRTVVTRLIGRYGSLLYIPRYDMLPHTHHTKPHHTPLTSRSHKILAGDFCRRTKQICTYLSIYRTISWRQPARAPPSPALHNRPRCHRRPALPTSVHPRTAQLRWMAGLDNDRESTGGRAAGVLSSVARRRWRADDRCDGDGRHACGA